MNEPSQTRLYIVYYDRINSVNVCLVAQSPLTPHYASFTPDLNTKLRQNHGPIYYYFIPLIFSGPHFISAVEGLGAPLRNRKGKKKDGGMSPYCVTLLVTHPGVNIFYFDPQYYLTSKASHGSQDGLLLARNHVTRITDK